MTVDRITTAEPKGFIAGAVAMLSALPGVACLMDEDGRVLGANAAFDRDLGAPADQIEWAVDLWPVIQDVLGTRQPIYHWLERAGGGQVGVLCQRFDVPGQATCVLMQEDRRAAPVAMDRRVSRRLQQVEEEREKARVKERRLVEEAQHWRQVSMTDRMTGLLNSTGFRDSAAAKLKTSTGAVLVYADLNGFKQVNDTLGHAAGDQLLRDVAQALTVATRSSDLVGRVGGDEFAILLSACANSDRDTVMRRLRAAMDRRLPVDHGTDAPAAILRVSAAMGHATYPEEARDVDSLLILADSRMYADKSTTRTARRGA